VGWALIRVLYPGITPAEAAAAVLPHLSRSADPGDSQAAGPARAPANGTAPAREPRR
jgi:hypothetical protein